MAKVVITEELLMEYSQSSNRITSDQRRAIVHYLAQNPHELERVMQMTAQALEIGVKRAPSSTEQLSDGQCRANRFADDEVQFREGLEQLYDSLSEDSGRIIDSNENNPFQKAADRVSRVINPFRRGIAALFDDDQQSVAACKSEDDKSRHKDKKHH